MTGLGMRLSCGGLRVAGSGLAAVVSLMLSAAPAFAQPVADTASIGDLVWSDLNWDGLQNAGEPGLGGVQINLFNSSSALIASTTTSSNGLYLFTGLPGGEYQIGFTLPPNYMFTFANIGSDTLDSDAGATGRSSFYTLAPNGSNVTVDAGLVRIPEPGTLALLGLGLAGLATSRRRQQQSKTLRRAPASAGLWLFVAGGSLTAMSAAPRRSYR